MMHIEYAPANYREPTRFLSYKIFVGKDKHERLWVITFPNVEAGGFIFNPLNDQQRILQTYQSLRPVWKDEAVSGNTQVSMVAYELDVRDVEVLVAIINQNIVSWDHYLGLQWYDAISCVGGETIEAALCQDMLLEFIEKRYNMRKDFSW